MGKGRNSFFISLIVAGSLFTSSTSHASSSSVVGIKLNSERSGTPDYRYTFTLTKETTADDIKTLETYLRRFLYDMQLQGVSPDVFNKRDVSMFTSSSRVRLQSINVAALYKDSDKPEIHLFGGSSYGSFTHEMGHYIRYRFLKPETIKEYETKRGVSLSSVVSYTTDSQWRASGEEVFAEDFKNAFSKLDSNDYNYTNSRFLTEKENEWFRALILKDLIPYQTNDPKNDEYFALMKDNVLGRMYLIGDVEDKEAYLSGSFIRSDIQRYFRLRGIQQYLGQLGGTLLSGELIVESDLRSLASIFKLTYSGGSSRNETLKLINQIENKINKGELVCAKPAI